MFNFKAFSLHIPVSIMLRNAVVDIFLLQQKVLRENAGHLNKANKELEDRVKELESALESSGAEIEKSLHELRRRNDELQQRNSVLEKQVEIAKEEHQERVSSLKQRLDEAQAKVNSAAAARPPTDGAGSVNTEEMDQLKTQIDQLKQQASEREQQIETLKKDLAHASTPVEVVSQKLDSLWDEGDKDENGSSKPSPALPTTSSGSDSADLLAAQQQVDQLNSEINVSSAKITSLQTELDQMKSTLAELESTNSKLDTELKATQKILEEKQNSWKSSEESHRHDLSVIRSQLEEKTKNLEKLQADLQSATQDSSKHTQDLQHQKTELEQKVSALEGEIQVGNEDREQLVAKLGEIQVECDQLKEEKAASADENKKLNSSLKSTKKKLKKAADDRDAAQQKLAELEAKIKADTEVATLKDSQFESFKTGMRQLSDSMADQDKKIETLSREKDELEVKAGALQEQLADALSERQDIAHKVAEAATEIQKLKDQIHALKETNQRTAVDCGRYKKESEEQKVELARLQDLTATQQVTLDQHNRQVDELQNQLKSRQEDLSTRGDNIKKLHEEISDLKAKLVEVETTFAQKQARLEQLEEELATERGIVDSLKEEFDSKIVSLEQQLKDREMEFKIAEKQNLRAIKDLQTRLKLSTLRRCLISLSNFSCFTSTDHGGMMSGSPMGSPARSASTSSLAPSTPASAGAVGVPASNPNTPRRISGDDSVGATPSGNSGKSQHQLDIETMGTRLGALQDRNFKLEEKVNALLAEISSLNDELEVKSRLIRKQSAMLKNRTTTATPTGSNTNSPMRTASLSPTGKGTPGGSGDGISRSASLTSAASSFLPGVVTSLFGGAQAAPQEQQSVENVSAEMNQTMGNVLEETLLKSSFSPLLVFFSRPDNSMRIFLPF
jgi:chromosome segregation ATPase